MESQSLASATSLDVSPVIKLNPIASISGQIDLPGSKSIANRMLLLAAMAEGETKLTNVPHGDDVQLMIQALCQLGVGITRISEGECCEDVVISGLGGKWPAGKHRLEVGNAGTVMRSLAAALCYGEGRYELYGTERMHERPLVGLMEGLRQLGVQSTYFKRALYPPLAVGRATKEGVRLLSGGDIWISGSQSSQFVSSALMAIPLGGKPVRLNLVGDLVSRPYVAMTISLMDSFGVQVGGGTDKCFEIDGGQHYRAAGEMQVEGDASSASYFLAGAAISGGDVTVTGCGLNSMQGDIRFAKVLEKMGALVQWGDNWVRVRGKGRGMEKRRLLSYRYDSEKPLQGIDVNMVNMPDVAITLAVIALFSEGSTTIRGIGNWRLKESNRMQAVTNELTKLGAKVLVSKDKMIIQPPEEVEEVAMIETYQDHRIAMSFSLVPCAGIEVLIQNPICVSKTFPHFFEKLFEMAVFVETEPQTL